MDMNDLLDKLMSLKEADRTVRIAQLSVDWKDDFDEKSVETALFDVGGRQIEYEFEQDEVDAKVMFVSSISLTDEQLQELWDAGDLFMGSREYWSGESFEDIVAQVKAFKAKEEGSSGVSG